jgi:hypothetical protein
LNSSSIEMVGGIPEIPFQRFCRVIFFYLIIIMARLGKYFAGPMNLEQMLRSLRSFLFMRRSGFLLSNAWASRTGALISCRVEAFH